MLSLWKKGSNAMLTPTESRFIEKLLKHEIDTLGSTVYLDDDETNAAARKKAAIKQIAEKLNELNKPKPMISKSDHLTIDDTLGADEIIFAKNGKPISRIRLS